MSGITLSASVRQNLLSLQSTTDLLSQTQERLSTGNKVNSALDNPTNYFTASSLNNRASDISNLLDGIGNGVQVLQAANTGITSLQSLISSAQSVANQALQATSGYTTKSQVVSTAISGATSTNLLGATTAATAGSDLFGTFSTLNVGAAGSSGAITGGTFSTIDVSGAGSAASSATVSEANNSFTGPLNVAGTSSTLAGTGTFATEDLSGSNNITFNLSFDGGTTTQPITIDAAAITAAGGTAATASEANVISALNTKINTAFGTTGITYAADNAGAIDITSGTAGTSAHTEITGYTETGTLGGTSSLANGTASAGTSAKNNTFAITLDAASSPTTVTIDQDAVNSFNAAPANSANQISASALSGADVASLINFQLGSNVASFDSTNDALDFTSTTTGTSSKITLGASAAAGGATNGIGVAAHAVTTGAALVPAAAVTFGVSVDGASSPTTITISAAARTAYNADSANSANLISDASSALSGADVAKLATYQLGQASVGASVSFNSVNNKLVVTSATTGTSSSVATTAGSSVGTASGSTGIVTAAASSGTTAASVSFGVTLDGASSPTTVTLSAAELTTYNADSANSASQISDAASALSGADVAKLINYQLGSNVASYDSTAGKLTLTSTTTGGNSSVAVGTATVTGGATNTTGSATASATAGTAASGGLTGQTLTIASTAGGVATNITFGTASGDVSTIDQLNTALASNNLEASIDTSGKLTITTVNDDASSQIGAIGGTSVSTSGAAFNTSTVAGPVLNTDAQNNRASLVSQYNNIIQQIKTTAQDSSFNGVNLLNGDQLKLVFNETGSSTLNIAGVTDDPAGLGLSSLTAGTDFVDNASTNKVLSSLTDASNTLRSQASTLGSNLSIVQIRQDFSKNLINVLQTGASNLTLADTNEEAANSQALSTRQSIAISALALANTSQQGVLQLLR